MKTHRAVRVVKPVGCAGLVLSIILVLLPGCASRPSNPAVPSVFKHEQAKNASVRQVAVLKTVDGEYTATIGRCVGVRKSDPDHAVYVQDYYHSTKYSHYVVDIINSEAHLLPGRYVCDVQCRKGNKSAGPVMVLNLRAGTTTKLRCEPVGTRQMKIYHLGLEKTSDAYFADQDRSVKEGKLRYVIRGYKQ